jgi:hypothetical protein
MSELVHFYSYATGISLELPLGFEAVAEDESSAAYKDSDRPGAPTFQVRVVGEVDVVGELDAVHGLAAGFAAVDGTLLAQRDFEVDEAPGRTVVMQRVDGAVVHQTALAAEGRLVSLVGTSPDSSLVAAYDAAILSIRVIVL